MLLTCSHRDNNRGETMEIASERYRRGFANWLRTGRWPIAARNNGVELKFNPYHDPRNGQFTFAPGGPRSLSRVIVSHGRQHALHNDRLALANSASTGKDSIVSNAAGGVLTLQEAVYRQGEQIGLTQASRAPRTPRGSNFGAFYDPVTLQQAIPNLQGQPGGAIIALTDTLFDITGPAQELTAQMTRDWSNQLITQIQALDPNYRFDSLGFPQTLQGQINQLNRLRFDRAAAFLRTRNEVKPLQVEILRFTQQRADQAYTDGIKLLRAGKLNIRLSEQEALGNFIDRKVRFDLRKQFDQYGIDAAGRGPVRVNRRENDSSGSELSFRLPDARVGDIAYDVTLTQKTLNTPQVRGFFNTDFKPSHVVIIRPHQVGLHASYVITRPETKQ